MLSGALTETCHLDPTQFRARFAQPPIPIECLNGANHNEEAWATLNSDTSRPFDKPTSGRIVKVINRIGNEVMKGFRVADANFRDGSDRGYVQREVAR